MYKLLIPLLVFFLVRSAQCQNAPLVHISDTDPRQGEEISVWYDAPDSSAFAAPIYPDTLFCAAIVESDGGEIGIVHPMRRDTGATYRSTLRIPDSASSVRIEICVPDNRVPDGITIFTCRNAKRNHPAGTQLDVALNVDSALDADMAMYPTHFDSYLRAFDIKSAMARAAMIEFGDSVRRLYLQSTIEKIKKLNAQTPSWFLTLSGLQQRAGNDSIAQQYLHDVAASTINDPIFQERDFWNYFFAPTQLPGRKMLYKTIEARLLAPLADRFPRTMLAKIWLERSANDTLVNTEIFKRIANVYTSSTDVDLLDAVAEAYANKKIPLYDPATALIWINKAEQSSRSRAGFYSGENIFGSMGRLGGIVSTKVEVLAALGKIDDAATLGRNTLVVVTEEYERQQLRSAIANAYLSAGKLEDAQRAFGTALGHGIHGGMKGLDELYLKTKLPDESTHAFVKRLTDTYGKVNDLPLVKDFSYTTIDGQSGSLASLRGKIVVMNCWFINSPGCALEAKSLIGLADGFAKDTGVVFLGIARDDAAAVKRYFEKMPTRFLEVPNGDGICDAIGVTGFPTHILIARDGSTLGWEVGGNEDEGIMLRQKILEALGRN